MDILNKEAWEQKALIKAGALSVQELMQETLARIKTVNPMVNALVDLLNEDDCVNLTSENYALEGPFRGRGRGQRGQRGGRTDEEKQGSFIRRRFWKAWFRTNAW